MPHALRAALLVCLLLPASAGAAVTTFDFSGTVSFVSNDYGMLNGSVSDGSDPEGPPPTIVTGTYQVDPTSTDETDTVTPFGVGFAQISFQLGDYLFQTSQDPHSIALENDTGAPGFEVDRWQSRAIFLSDLSPTTSNHGGSFAGYLAQIEFYDFDRGVFDGTETEPFVPGEFTLPWDELRLTLNSVDGSLVYDDRVKVQVNITSWGAQPVPEPRSAALLVLGLASLAHRRRRATRSR